MHMHICAQSTELVNNRQDLSSHLQAYKTLIEPHCFYHLYRQRKSAVWRHRYRYLDCGHKRALTVHCLIANSRGYA
jgi:hypothetical protein